MEQGRMSRGRRKKRLPPQLQSKSFAKGNKAWQLHIKKDGSANPLKFSEYYTRLPKDIYDEADTDSIIKPSYLRARDTKKTKTEVYMDATPEDIHIIGNRMVCMSKMADLFNACYKGHTTSNPECPGQFYFPASEEKPKGICTSVKLTCRMCNYSTVLSKMYEEVVTEHVCGQHAARPNVQLTHFLSKSPISQFDVQLLFASIDSVCLATSNIQKCINKYSSTWTQANNDQLRSNRQQLKSIIERKHGTPMTEVEVAAEVDTSYSSPPKGRAMSQPANQSLTPLLENVTKKKMLIGLTSFSKLCSLGPNCNRQHEGCGMNWGPTQPISNSEKQAGRDMYLENINEGIKIVEIVHDGVMPNTHAKGMNLAAQEKGLNGPESQLCTVHLSRGLKRKAFSMNVSKELTGKDAKVRSAFIQKLAMAIDHRCTCELARAKEKYEHHPDKFEQFMKYARLNILDCFSGNHTTCKLGSLACNIQAHPNKLPAFLPNSQYLNLDDEDRSKLQQIIDYKVSAERVKSQRYLRNTNKVEAFHLRCLKVTPKSKTCKRNYGARNSSAAHNASVGIGNSIINLNEMTGSTLQKGSKSAKALHKLTQRVEYLAKRQGGLVFKRRRRLLRERKLRLQRIKAMSITDVPVPPSIREEHSYYIAD